MKIQCNVCEMAEATVLCCADEAALCSTCDEKVHAANKLASKHQRVHLSTYNSQMPMCDICQETVGYFFCLEDRALLCRKCDVAIHTANTLVSSHQRFLLTGVKVGLEAAELGASTSSMKLHYTKDISDAPKSPSPSIRSVSLSSTDKYSKPEPVQAAGAGDFTPPSLPFAGGSSEDGIQQWEFDEFLGLTDLNQNYNYIDNISSKADSGKLGDSDCEGFGQVPDASWAVPDICSPPTASGLYFHDHYHHHHRLETPAFVPDVCYSAFPDLYPSQQSTSSQKKRRQF
ncbi:B-box zinc finger protein 22-like [Cynara cardunculus var. scolymus]|uniref:B box-type domain-containing protein n=1 Tax=Cynara cardunculus var. scolymus TaxID=59895 RepID=A0A124SHT6_CYNCS|nr:B-box zinc finger protein 22-like [Cynara cardunculus var. scolymus]KVI10547.1 hypothetical protein Ccrd_011058 [Cynara cardunculus var. scolymus]